MNAAYRAGTDMRLRQGSSAGELQFIQTVEHPGALGGWEGDEEALQVIKERFRTMYSTVPLKFFFKWGIIHKKENTHCFSDKDTGWLKTRTGEQLFTNIRPFCTFWILKNVNVYFKKKTNNLKKKILYPLERYNLIDYPGFKKQGQMTLFPLPMTRQLNI